MYGRNRKFVSMAVAIVLIISLSGCIQAGYEKQEQISKDSILSPVTIPYLIRNPIEEIHTEKSKEGWVQRTLTISGLKDQAMEKSINDRLTGIYNKMIGGELPPYRGIRQAVPEKASLSSINVDASVSFNYNNVLSVMVYSNWSMDGNGTNPLFIGVLEPLTIDLRTGEEIQLKDIFADDTDYQRLLSDLVQKRLQKSNPMEENETYLDMMSGGLRLVAPFKGIREDQKFALYQGGLVLIIDYENPEFNTGFYANSIYIPFEELGPVVAVAERFYDPEEDLYQSEKPLVYEFIQMGSLDMEQKQELSEINGIQVYQTLRYPKDLPEAALKKLQELQKPDEKMIQLLKENAGTQEEGNPVMEHNVWAVKAGRYINVSRNLSAYSRNVSYGSRLDYCYDEKGNLVTLDDVFVKDFHWEALVLSGLEKAFVQDPSLNEMVSEDWISGLQFALGLSEINFTTQPIKRQDGSEYPLYFSLTYEEIGCSNLMVFDSP